MHELSQHQHDLPLIRGRAVGMDYANYTLVCVTWTCEELKLHSSYPEGSFFLPFLQLIVGYLLEGGGEMCSHWLPLGLRR